MPFTPTNPSLQPRQAWRNAYWTTLMADVRAYLGTIDGGDLDVPVRLSRPSQSLVGGGNWIRRFKRWMGPDSLTAVVPTGTCIRDVTGFGARGDGVTDDTVAIQDAIDDLPAGGIVLVPPGRYLINDPITLSTTTDDTPGVALVGFGDASILVAGTNFPDTPALGLAMIRMAGAETVLSSFRIANLRLEGNKANQAGSTEGIAFNKVSNSRVFNVTVNDVKGTGITMYGGECNQVLLSRCLACSDYGILVQVDAPAAAKRALFKGLRLEGTLAGFRATGMEASMIRSVHAVGPGTTGIGIELFGNGVNSSCSGNTIRSCLARKWSVGIRFSTT